MGLSVLRSNIAIQASVLIVRAFVAIRQLIANPPVDRVGELEKQIKELRAYMEEVFTDYNDINEDTRMLIFSVITTVPVSMMRQERV